MSDKVSAHVKLTAQPGKGAELVAAFDSLYEGPLDAEAGTLIHVISQAKDNPDVVFFYELYESEDAMSAHTRGEALRAVYPKLAGLMAGGAEMTTAIPKRAKGIDL